MLYFCVIPSDNHTVALAAVQRCGCLRRSSNPPPSLSVVVWPEVPDSPDSSQTSLDPDMRQLDLSHVGHGRTGVCGESGPALPPRLYAAEVAMVFLLDFQPRRLHCGRPDCKNSLVLGFRSMRPKATGYENLFHSPQIAGLFVVAFGS